LSVYAESSAVLAWLLDESSAPAILEALAGAEAVYASELTLVECDRAIILGAHLADFSEADAERCRGELAAASASWRIIQMTDEVTARARRAFPAEPVRTLDALHLASALLARSASADLSLVALDERVRRNARGLGLELLPT
jgi:uncharacterized protein with PIN domain